MNALRKALAILSFAVACAALGAAWAQGWALPVCADRDNLPFSNDRGEGFENRITAILADELGAEVHYVYLDAPHPIARNRLVHGGACDLAMGVVDGNPGFLTTLAYYRSSYVFVQRQDAPFTIGSFDDEILKDLRIGIQMPTGESVSGPARALATRGLQANQVIFRPAYGRSDPLAGLVDQVADDEVDVAVVWGPVAGYFAARANERLRVVPVEPQIELPFLPLVHPIAIGVRPDDVALRDRLNLALSRRWEDIQGVLEAYDVPLLPLPRPSVPGDAGP